MDCAKAAAAAAAMDCTGLELLRGGPSPMRCPSLPCQPPPEPAVRWAGARCSPTTPPTPKSPSSVAPCSPAGPGGPGADLHRAPAVTASTGLDVIAHSLDAMCSVRANPVSDGLAVRAAKLAFENLEAAFRDGSDAVARERMAMASTIAGYAFSNTGTTGSHACSYLLTAKYHIPHGEACALTLDAWFRKDAAVRPLLHTLSRMMGFADANAAADRLAELKELTGMRTTLTAMGVPDTQEALDELAANAAASGNMANDICKATREDIASLFASLR
ncbi:iron-containing alcohol dehydrogenase [Flavonifractor plautii]|nr:iron-containing alcohol dehydrogenase [Flavonifractor plautii]